MVGWIRSADPRMKIVVTLILGILTWNSGVVGIVTYGISLGCLLILFYGVTSMSVVVFRPLITFVLFWMIMRLALGFLEDASGRSVLQNALLMGGRLFVLMCLGLILAGTTSTRSLGMAISWFIRWMGFRNAWQAALALSLMIHFLPLTWKSVLTIRQTLLRRCGGVRWPQRFILLSQCLIRTLSQKTWQQTLAIAVRRLDGADAWRPDFENRPRDIWIGALLVVGAATAAAL